MRKTLLSLLIMASPALMIAQEQRALPSRCVADSLTLPCLDFYPQSAAGQSGTPSPRYAPAETPSSAPAIIKKSMKPSFGAFTDEPDMPHMFGFNWSNNPNTIMQIERPDMTETHLLDATDWPVTIHLRNGNLEGSYFSDNQGGSVLMQASYTVTGQQNWQRTQFVSRDEYVKRSVRTAYDPHKDVMYGLSVVNYDNKDKFGLVRYNADVRIEPGTGRSVNPYENIIVITDNMPAECECSSLTWDPRDGNLIGVGINGDVIRFNTTDGSYKVLFNTGLPNSTYFGGLAYSPEDRGFIWVYLVRDDEGATVSQDYYLINTDSKSCKLLKSIPKGEEGPHQVSSLIINENYIDPLAPTVPVLKEDTFADKAGSGTLTIEIPTMNSKGLPLSGALNYYLRVDGVTYTDGKSYIETTVKPGDTRTETISGLSDGMHRLTVYVTTPDGHWSAPLNISKFVGNDTPAAPENVTLTAESLSWSPVTVGVHGVDLTAADIEYEVWVDEQLVGTTTDTSYPMQFDEVELLSHLAAVRAINHGNKSALSYSNRITAGKYRTIPATYAPVASDILLSTVVDMEGDDFTWYYNNAYKAFYKSYAWRGGSNDDWLFLPPLCFDDPEALYELSFEFKTGNYDEALEVRLCDEPVADTGDVVLTTNLNTTKVTSDFAKVTTIIPAAGIKQIALHPALIHSDIYVRNVQVKKTGSDLSAPAAVTNLTVAHGEKGALPCTASFTFPTVNVKGEPLAADADITVEVSGVYKEFTPATVSGKPGAAGQVTFTPTQGRTDIFVQPIVDDNRGLLAQANVWAGKDVPAHVKNLKVSIGESPMEVHIDFDGPGEEGYNGGWADPSTTRYYLLAKRADASKWTKFDPVDYTEIRLDLNDTFTQTLTQYAILTENAAGTSNTWDATDITCGIAYTLPMRETMVGGLPEFNPVVTQTPTEEYTGSCGFADAGQLKPEYAVATGNVIGMMPPADGSAGKAMLEFPLFSTVGAKRPAFVAQALLDKDLIAHADIYAVAYGQEPVKLGSWDASTPGSGYTSLVFPLPASLVGKQWVKVYIDASFDAGDRRFVVISRYSVMELKDNDMAILSATTPAHTRINREATLSAVVTNNTATPQAAPQLTVSVTDCTGTVTTGTATPVTDTPIGTDEEREYRFMFTPNSDLLGNMTFALSLPDDEVNTNNSYEALCSVEKGDAIICTTLTAERDEANKCVVHLSWDEPTIFSGVEDIEGMASFDHGRDLGSFLNIDLDGSQTYTWENWDFPGEEEPHAFIVFDDTYSKIPTSSSSVLKAHSGHKFLMALAPLNYVTANDWLISPEVEPGSDISFWLSTISTAYGDDFVGIYVSDGSTDPDDFEMLQFKRKNTEGWEQLTATLPKDAKRFAIHFYSNDTFGILIDDIEYTPAGGLATLTGFELERDGELIQSFDVPTYAHDDNGVTEHEQHAYNVYPTIVRENGTVGRGEASPTAMVDATNSIATPAAADLRITVNGHTITATGLEGLPATLSTADGLIIPATTLSQEAATYHVSTGLYLLTVGPDTYKIMVR
ncbi:MAG: choice-of-anchor J domain-containing protein [Muribaculaceae bacterium]|nr:choice-of-anchor J domain-containing protein [Muribaculaceae bacterium]